MISAAAPAGEVAASRFLEAEARLLRSLQLQPTETILQLETAERVRVLEFGSGPPLVLLPGLGAVAAVWAPLLANLTGFHLLAVERPGCGLSSPLDFRNQDLRTWATGFVGALRNALGLDQVSIVGNSIGGTSALWYASAFPEHVHRLVLIGAPPLVLDAQVPLGMRLLTVPFIAHKALASSSPAQVDRIFTDMGHPSGTVAGELLEVVTAARALPHYADGFVGLLRAATSLRGRRVELSAADLSRIGAPTLLIWGARDTHGGVRTGRRLVEVMPDARLELCGEGHLPWLDDPAGCGHLVRAFLGA